MGKQRLMRNLIRGGEKLEEEVVMRGMRGLGWWYDWRAFDDDDDDDERKKGMKIVIGRVRSSLNESK